MRARSVLPQAVSCLGGYWNGKALMVNGNPPQATRCSGGYWNVVYTPFVTVLPQAVLCLGGYWNITMYEPPEEKPQAARCWGGYQNDKYRSKSLEEPQAAPCLGGYWNGMVSMSSSIDLKPPFFGRLLEPHHDRHSELLAAKPPQSGYWYDITTGTA